MTIKSSLFSCGNLNLEGISHFPEGKGPLPAVIVCHPHSLYGGSMHNNVVLALCSALIDNGIMAFRFNFRGVGQSQGEFGEGIAEQQDVAAAIDFVSSQPEVDGEKIGLAAYSFGTIAATPVALRDCRIQALMLISPPLATSTWQELAQYSKPKLILSGDRDMFVAAPEIRRLLPELVEPRQIDIMHGADHFWGGYEEELGLKATIFFSRYL